MTAYPPHYPEPVAAVLSNLPPAGGISRYAGGSKGSRASEDTSKDTVKTKDKPISYIELICQTRDLEELDTRIRINLQQALIQFIKDENQWTRLPFSEQNRLLQKLTSRSKQNPFSEKITIKSQDNSGNLIEREAYLLLDTTRNKNLSIIFDQIVNQELSLVFREQFCFGLIEHIDHLLKMEMRMMALNDRPDSHVLPISYFDIENNFLPLSAQDLTLIKANGLGIMIQLIPKFLRLPLNKFYYAVKERNREIPSLALHFYLDRYFATWGLERQDVQERVELIRTLFSKSFYAISRLGGLKMEHFNLPDVNRADRFMYLTTSDDEETIIMTEDPRTDAIKTYSDLRQELQRLRQKEQLTRQRREQEGPSIEVQLTYETMLDDIFTAYRHDIEKHSNSEEEFLTRTLWIPTRLEPLTEWDRNALLQGLERVEDPEHLVQLSIEEQELIQSWATFAEQEIENPKTLAQLKVLGNEDLDYFREEVRIRFFQRYQVIVSQHETQVAQAVLEQITRMLRIGSITAEMVLQRRYEAFQTEILPYIYFYSTPNSQGETTWFKSPYPFGKLCHLIQRIEHFVDAEDKPIADAVSLALGKSLLVALLVAEQDRILNAYPDLTDSSTEDPRVEDIALG